MNPRPRTFEEQVIQDLAIINTKLDDFLGEEGRMRQAEKRINRTGKKLDRVVYALLLALITGAAFAGPKALSFLVHFIP